MFLLCGPNGYTKYTFFMMFAKTDLTQMVLLDWSHSGLFAFIRGSVLKILMQFFSNIHFFFFYENSFCCYLNDIKSLFSNVAFLYEPCHEKPVCSYMRKQRPISFAVTVKLISAFVIAT